MVAAARRGGGSAPALQGSSRHGRSSGGCGEVRRRCGEVRRSSGQSGALLGPIAPAIVVGEEGGSGEVGNAP